MTKYKIPSLTTDIFIYDSDFNFILIKRKNDPYKDCWALPGGFVEYAVYNIDHPLTGKPQMTIKTKRGKRPRAALKKAAEELQKESSEFKQILDEAL